MSGGLAQPESCPRDLMSLLPVGAGVDSVAVSFFRSAYDQDPIKREIRLVKLASRLCEHPLRADVVNKLTLPCWSPALFRGTRALSEDVSVISCLVLDVDDGPSPDDLLQRLEGIAYIAASSWSHQPPRHRYRVVLPLARPVAAAVWPQAWTISRDALDIPADSACRSINRRYILSFAPSADSVVFGRCELERPFLDLAAVTQPAAPRRKRSMPVRVPPWTRDRIALRRLNTDPETRRRAASHLGADLAGAGQRERATGIRCDGCGRSSAWFWIEPARASHVRCSHLRSCGWHAPLADIIGGTS